MVYDARTRPDPERHGHDAELERARERAEAWAADTPPICGICDEPTENPPGLHGYRICDPCKEA